MSKLSNRSARLWGARILARQVVDLLGDVEQRVADTRAAWKAAS